MSEQRMESVDLKTERKKTQFGAGLQLPTCLFPLRKHLSSVEQSWSLKLSPEESLRKQNNVVSPGGTRIFGSSVSRD